MNFQQLSSLYQALGDPVSPNQVIAIRYTPPYQLPAHKDAHVFDGTIHTLCLGSGVALTFHDGERRYDIEHPGERWSPWGATQEIRAPTAFFRGKRTTWGARWSNVEFVML